VTRPQWARGRRTGPLKAAMVVFYKELEIAAETGEAETEND